jgi:C4-dicarboxylate-specific signal transduction histidine kinase
MVDQSPVPGIPQLATELKERNSLTRSMWKAVVKALATLTVALLVAVGILAYIVVSRDDATNRRIDAEQTINRETNAKVVQTLNLAQSVINPQATVESAARLKAAIDQITYSVEVFIARADNVAPPSKPPDVP